MTPAEPKLQQEIDALKQRFEDAPRRAREERDAGLRDLVSRYGLRQVDLVTRTGYSRETIRQALNPEALAAVQAARRRPMATLTNEQVAAYVVAHDQLSIHNPSDTDERVIERAAREIVTELWPRDDPKKVATNRSHRETLARGIADSLHAQGAPVGLAAIDHAIQAVAKLLAEGRKP